MAPNSLQILTLWLALEAGFVQAAVPIIQTTSGKIRGKAVSNATNAYLGIPFAQPPVGPLRFLAPKPLLTPSVTRNATAWALMYSARSQPPDPSPAGEDWFTIN
ncbi:SubName: Full=Uncharacterized protein {ECO:0000313/EMBL:CCA76747.1}; Flags: Fragment, partial [Serendipita indica DSM 11827]